MQVQGFGVSLAPSQHVASNLGPVGGLPGVIDTVQAPSSNCNNDRLSRMFALKGKRHHHDNQPSEFQDDIDSFFPPLIGAG